MGTSSQLDSRVDRKRRESCACAALKIDKLSKLDIFDVERKCRGRVLPKLRSRRTRA